jgi:hypothetical protein
VRNLCIYTRKFVPLSQKKFEFSSPQNRPEIFTKLRIFKLNPCYKISMPAIKIGRHKIRDYAPRDAAGLIVYYTLCGETLVCKSFKDTEDTNGENFHCIACLDEFLITLDALRACIVRRRDQNLKEKEEIERQFSSEKRH